MTDPIAAVAHDVTRIALALKEQYLTTKLRELGTAAYLQHRVVTRYDCACRGSGVNVTTSTKLSELSISVALCSCYRLEPVEAACLSV